VFGAAAGSTDAVGAGVPVFVAAACAGTGELAFAAAGESSEWLRDNAKRPMPTATTPTTMAVGTASERFGIETPVTENGDVVMPPV
jgi:hypothetical protein